MAMKIERILQFLRQLNSANIHYALDHDLDDAISVRITVPGERWEVDFQDDGIINVEVFKSDGKMYDESKLDELFTRFAD